MHTGPQAAPFQHLYSTRSRMVFATEFDPRNQSQHRQQNKARSQSLSSGESPQASSPNSDRPSPVRALSNPPQAKVVPLQVGGPARRVRLDAKTTLALPAQPKLPWGLRLLNRLQQGSAAVTGVLVTGALVVYGSTVYIDKSTSRAIMQLDALQGESQQLTSANEAIKQTLAEQAIRADSGLQPYEAGDVLFVSPEPPREKLEPAATEPAEMPGPLGY